MKVAILGAGNMGGAIARGLAQGQTIRTSDIIVTNPSTQKLAALKNEFPDMNVSTDNALAADADVVIVAVKPWKVEEVLRPLHLCRLQMLVSVASGVSFHMLSDMVDPEMPMFRVLPNTAISQLASMTLVSAHNATEGQTQDILDIFDEMGMAMLMDEKLLPAATSLTSCGIAYVLKYVQAAMQAGVELGLRPEDAMKMLAQTLDGAARLLLADECTRPSLEIEKVTTPGGITIKGINQLEADGFTASVIRAIKASV